MHIVAKHYTITLRHIPSPRKWVQNMSRTIERLKAAAREYLASESGHPDFSVVAVEPRENGRLYVITVPLTVIRRGFSGKTTKFGWSLLRNLNAIPGCDVSHYAELPTGFTLYVGSEVPSDPLPYRSGTTRELPADACVAIQATIMRYRKRRHKIVEFFRSI